MIWGNEPWQPRWWLPSKCGRLVSDRGWKTGYTMCKRRLFRQRNVRNSEIEAVEGWNPGFGRRWLVQKMHRNQRFPNPFGIFWAWWIQLGLRWHEIFILALVRLPPWHPSVWYWTVPVSSDMIPLCAAENKATNASQNPEKRKFGYGMICPLRCFFVLPQSKRYQRTKVEWFPFLPIHIYQGPRYPFGQWFQSLFMFPPLFRSDDPEDFMSKLTQPLARLGSHPMSTISQLVICYLYPHLPIHFLLANDDRKRSTIPHNGS